MSAIVSFSQITPNGMVSRLLHYFSQLNIESEYGACFKPFFLYSAYMTVVINC